MRHGRRTADAGDDAGGSRLVRARADRDHRQRRQPGGDRQGALGRYGPRAFRNLSPALREKYFTPAGDQWIVVPELQRRVSYDVVNLVAADEVARHAAAPIIFCRNVFIYFSDHSIRRTLATFAARCPIPATCASARAESLLRLRTPFDLQEIGGAFVYVKDRTPAARAGTRSRRREARGSEWIA